MPIQGRLPLQRQGQCGRFCRRARRRRSSQRCRMYGRGHPRRSKVPRLRTRGIPPLINGFIIIDKPAGITSHDVVSRVRRILGTRRVGHTGTLDPFATGVLPVAVNEGTKAIPFLDEGIKCYEALMRLGVATDTLDTTGVVLREADCSSVSKERFSATLSRFTGSISQIPPMFSAIKRDGQPLYKLARQGVEVER